MKVVYIFNLYIIFLLLSCNSQRNFVPLFDHNKEYDKKSESIYFKELGIYLDNDEIKKFNNDSIIYNTTIKDKNFQIYNNEYLIVSVVPIEKRNSSLSVNYASNYFYIYHLKKDVFIEFRLKENRVLEKIKFKKNKIIIKLSPPARTQK